MYKHVYDHTWATVPAKTMSEARGTAATPLDDNIKVPRIESCVPIGRLIPPAWAQKMLASAR